MQTAPLVSADDLRSLFSRAMSDMYRSEVPQYGTLLDIVATVNARHLAAHPALAAALAETDDLARISLERHGAIRLGTAEELATMRRLFAVMGMEPVGYYDLAPAGVPVHSTAFRPVSAESLARNPFRVFTSLLRLDLIADAGLRAQAAAILKARRIFTPALLDLIAKAEAAGGLAQADAARFVSEALETFRWHRTAMVDGATYRALHRAHRLIADVVCFKGPHINHLTPRTLDIDAVQALMPAHGIAAKAVIEGPPRRACPILLRQTSFKALEEAIDFPEAQGLHSGTHTARFGEIEQRGMALTPKGRALYDRLLASVRETPAEVSAAEGDADYAARLAAAFDAFPDDAERMRAEGLGFFRYTAGRAPQAAAEGIGPGASLGALIAAGALIATPLTYEDFLPVSAAGIFQSNLGDAARPSYAGPASRGQFMAALGAEAHDETTLYAAAERASLEDACRSLGLSPAALAA
ncbi:2-oxoadipate dioxygenase/decarboxylase HglS [Acidisoma sp. C75]